MAYQEVGRYEGTCRTHTVFSLAALHLNDFAMTRHGSGQIWDEAQKFCVTV